MSDTRGIVLESNHGWSTILMEGGQYKKVRRTLEVGDIYLENRKKPYWKYTAAAVFLLVLLGTIDFFNVVAYASVSTGIEMGINRWDRVITVKQTGAAPDIELEDLHLQGQKLEKAVAILVQNVIVDNQSPQDVEIQVNSQNNGNDKLEEKLLVKIETSVEQDNTGLKNDTTLVRNGKNIHIKTKENQGKKNNPPGQLKHKDKARFNPSGSQNANPASGKVLWPASGNSSEKQPAEQMGQEQNQNNLGNTGGGLPLGQNEPGGPVNEDNQGNKMMER